MARPKMMATMKKRARVEKPKDDTAYCAWMKIEERLFDGIIRFFDKTFNKGVTRKELKKTYRVDRKFLKEITSFLSEAEVAALKRNIKWKGIPTVLENKLTALYKEGNEGYLNEKMEPYSIVETCGDLGSSKVPLDVSSPELVIADLTTSPDWDQSSFERLFSLFYQCRDIKFVLVAYILDAVILDFLTLFNKFKHLELAISFKFHVGFYEADMKKEESKFPMKGQGFLKVVVFITAHGQEFSECPLDRKTNLLCKKPLVDDDYYLRQPRGETEEQRKDWILNHAPSWNMVDNEKLPKKGRVHVYCKRQEDIEDMIYNWSTCRGIVIDIFSGGVVLRAGLQAARHFISFVRSSQEAIFLQSFVKRLKVHCPNTKAWCYRYI
ncbi:hypothetical protein R1sor_021636 [Riccia sorocarpa]|uniref:Uncharacterized protein n=1 Tax=Riccia sorocarpa TaxID=122646 RepID=A0ABD3GKQ8_9MARC